MPYIKPGQRIPNILVKTSKKLSNSLCKLEMDQLLACWRLSGVDNKNCVALVASLASCAALSVNSLFQFN